MKTAIQAAFEAAWLNTTNQRFIKQAIRVIDKQEKQSNGRQHTSKVRTTVPLRKKQ